MSESSTLSPQRIFEMTWGYAAPLILETAVRYRLFNHLDEKAKDVAELAADAGASERGLRAILDALVGFELLTKDENGNYANTPESSAFLVVGKPSYQGGVVELTSSHLLPVWLQLTEVVKTGRPVTRVNEEGPGSEFFQVLVESIFPMSYQAALLLGEALGLKEATGPVKVLDIAAGSGVWGVGLAQQSPQVTVTAIDWEGILPVTRRIAARHGLEDRFEFVAGDILETDYSEGYQVATLGHIIHSEGEARSKELLAKVFTALAPGGTIAIAEMVPNHDRTGPLQPLLFAVNMVVSTEVGNTFSFEEMSQWMLEAGYTNIRQLEAPAPSPLILADKPGV